MAFASRRDGNVDVYVTTPDGRSEVRLTTSPGADRYPAWSPDGRSIAFTSDRDGNEEIYVMTAGGAGQTNVSRSPLDADVEPAWSPDGGTILFTRERGTTRVLSQCTRTAPCRLRPERAPVMPARELGRLMAPRSRSSATETATRDLPDTSERGRSRPLDEQPGG